MVDTTKPQSGIQTDRNLALELVRVTEAAALAASHWIGHGKKNEADGAAVEAMRKAFDAVAIDGTVVIGEGEMDEAPMLFIGEKVGAGGPAMDIAVDPLEGTTLTAKAGPNAMATLALAENGNFLHAPDIYMDKIAVGGGLPAGVVNLDDSVASNLRNLARAKKREISELVACILDRDRHKELIAHCRSPPRCRIPISTSTWVPVARRKACWPRRRCVASAARCRGACCTSRTTRSNASEPWVMPIRSGAFRWRRWRRAT
jgi:fructose-1,6-bisphosphatase II / sedoheptulose-1,7-bisphosphatase